MNGGAWLTVDGRRVDFLYRNIQQIERVIDDAKAGRFVHEFRQQPPFGFFSTMYLAEVQICRSLVDRGGVVDELKRRVESYPAALKRAMLQDSLWSADFTLSVAEPWAEASEPYTAMASATRAAYYLTQAIFALNEQYFLSDKTTLDEIARFELAPRDYGHRVRRALAGESHLGEAHADLVSLVRETAALAGGLYRRPYD